MTVEVAAEPILWDSALVGLAVEAPLVVATVAESSGFSVRLVL